MRRMFMVLFGFSMVVAAFVLGSLVHNGINADDSIAFLGAVVGAGLTVGGAVYVTGNEAAAKRHEARLLLIELLEELLSAAKAVRTPEGDERFPAVNMQSSAAHTLAHRIQPVQDARQWIVPDGAPMVRAFGFIGEIGDRTDWDKRAETLQWEHEPQDFSVELERVDAMASAALRELNRVR